MVMKTKINDDEDDIFLPGYIIKVPAIQARLKADQTRRPGDQSRAEQGKERWYALCAMLQHGTLEEESVKPTM